MKRKKTALNRWIAAFVVAILAAFFRPAAEENGRVVTVHDGDTLTLMTPAQEKVKVRLQGIDAPEYAQPFGEAATRLLTQLVLGQSVRIETSGTDRYGRTLGQVYVNEIWINRELVARGLAWHYLQYSNDSRLAEAQARAASYKTGLWQQPRPLPPWEWRRLQTKGRQQEHQ